MTTTFLPASLDRLFSRALIASAVSAASLLAACGGGAGTATSAAQSATGGASAAATPATTTAADTATGASTAGTGTASASDVAQQDAIRTASALSGTAGTATLSWKAVTGAVSYRVYYGTASRSYLQPLGSGIPAATPSVTLSGLTSGQTYYFSVTGVDSTGLETAYSDEMTGLVP